MKAAKKIEKYKLRQCVENEMRVSRPKQGFKTDYSGSRTAAIGLFCLSCMGGSRPDVVGCKSFSCPLWQFRPGGSKGVQPPGIPTAEQYKELIDASVSDKQREAGRKLKDK